MKTHLVEVIQWWRIEQVMAIAWMTNIVDDTEYGTPPTEGHVIVCVHEAETNHILFFIGKAPNSVCQSTQKFECQPVVGVCVLKDKIMQSKIVT